MNGFLVSARKYRPLRWTDVIGQDHITQTLKNSLARNQVAHAFLFCGPRGVGKTTCARIMARVLNCENPTPDWEPCNQCKTCQAFQENNSFNIFEIDAEHVEVRVRVALARVSQICQLQRAIGADHRTLRPRR